jgi:hypothetical protein
MQALVSLVTTHRRAAMELPAAIVETFVAKPTTRAAKIHVVRLTKNNVVEIQLTVVCVASRSGPSAASRNPNTISLLDAARGGLFAVTSGSTAAATLTPVSP